MMNYDNYYSNYISTGCAIICKSIKLIYQVFVHPFSIYFLQIDNPF